MSIYVTCEGTKLTAELPQELREQLTQAEPVYGRLWSKFKNQSNHPQTSQNLNSDQFIAELIQNDYLSVIDPVDG